ncbi:MAG: DUF3881 family protein [Lachnospiraceae bacterium]|jgi:hypothetical protein|nr:DUF3881 family protein [Lachnospiraceae bacterium]
MLRKFSAIGMSQYTSQRNMDRLINELLQKNQLRGQQFIKAGEMHVEIFKDMGPFRMVLRGELKGKDYINIFMAVPALREKRGYSLVDCEFQESTGDSLYLAGQEQATLEGLCLQLTEVHRYYLEPHLKGKTQLYTSCYGLSTEGKVLLGIERSKEDEEAIRESEAWRRELLERAMQGDEEAYSEIQYDEDLTQQEIEERLQKEDVYSIFDGFMYPAERADNHFFLLGDILRVEKLMNSYTEEWVYYLELEVLGQVVRVCINPRDLLGDPQPGRRFLGQVYFYGRLDPARMILEDQNTFF